MTRFTKMAILLAFPLALLAACGGGGNGGAALTSDDLQNPSGTIVVGGWGAASDAFESVMSYFNEAFPDIEVDLQMDMAGGDYREVLITALAAGSGAADVTMIEGAWIGELRESPALINLLEYPFNAGRFRNDFVEFRWDMATALDGRQTGIPWDMGPATLFYRRDVFRDAGLPSEPDEVEALLSTWDGFLYAAERIHIPGERWIIPAAQYLFFWQFINRDYFNERLELQLYRPGAIEALETAITMRQNGWDAQVGMWSTEATVGFGSGAIASHVAGAWRGGALKTTVAPDSAGDWGVTRIPAGTPPSNWGGSFLAIPAQTSNPAAAWAFIEFTMTRPEIQNTMFDAMDYFPALATAWGDPIYYYEDAYFGGQQARALWVDIANNIVPTHTTMLDSLVEAQILGAVNAGIEAGLDARGILDFVYESVEASINVQRQAAIDVLRDAGMWHE